MAAETKIVISADTAKANDAILSLGKSFDGLQRKMFDFSGVAATLTGALSVTAFAGMIKGSIDMADRLNDLSKRTGASVETLSGFRLAADQSGTSLDAVALGTKKLAVSLSEHPAIFAKLGISTTNQTEAMIQLADVFAGMDDPVQRSALAVKIFGKSGDELIPMLMEGSVGLRKMIKDGSELAPITTEMARQSDLFNDQLARMKLASSELGISLANDLLPSLNKFVEQLIEGKKIFGGFVDAMFMAGTMSPFKSWGEHAKSLRAEIAGLEEDKKRFSGFGSDTSAIDTSIATLKRKLEWAKYNQNQEALALLPQGGYRDEGARGLAAPGPNTTGKKLLSDLNGGSAKKSKDFDPENDFWFAVDNAAMKNQKQRNEEYLKELDSAAAESLKIIDKVNTAAAEEMNQMRFETSLLGLNTVEVQKRTEARRIELALEKELLALRGNDKFKTRDSNTAVAAEYQAAVDAANAAAKATKKGALDEIAARNEVTRSWEFGSKEAIRKYVDEVTNAAAQSERLFGNAFKGMEDALVKFVRTGKLDFASLADNIINDLIRIQIQQSIMKPIASAMESSGGLGGLFGGLFGSTPAVTSTGATASSWTSTAMPMLPSFAVGTDYVPRDMIAQIHEGERIVPRAFNPAAGGSSAATPPNLILNFNNNSGQAVTAKQQGGPQFDGRDWILGVVLEAADSNPHFRNAMGMAR